MQNFTLDNFLPYQLAVLASRISREFSDIYATKFGLSVPEWRVLVHLYNAGPVSVREIQARVDMDKSKTSRAASRLEKSGYITKDINIADRRLVKLTLSEQGHKLMAQLIPLALGFDSDLDTRLGADAESFRKIMTKLLKAPE